jgi:hypothetical protein
MAVVLVPMHRWVPSLMGTNDIRLICLESDIISVTQLNFLPRSNIQHAHFLNVHASFHAGASIRLRFNVHGHVHVYNHAT